jgi:hypothetical protein
MSPTTYVAKLKKLGYTPYNADTLLGISRASSFRYAAGTQEVPEYVVKLLTMFEQHGAPAAPQRQRGRPPKSKD